MSQVSPQTARWTTRLLPLEEELLNIATHGIGLGFSLFGMAWLAAVSMEHGSVWHVVGSGVFGITLILAYAASTIYHSVQNERRKQFFRIIDQVCIYLLIAGSYTPFALVERGPWDWTFLTLVWMSAITGIVHRVVYPDRLDAMCYTPYIAVGGLGIVALTPIFGSFPVDVVLWIASGGAAYLVGVYFVVKDHRYYHAVWHLLALTGSSCHYCAVLRFLDSHP